jgi:5-methylcytosine-specific restriction endonuclease McrA
VREANRASKKRCAEKARVTRKRYLSNPSVRERIRTQDRARGPRKHSREAIRRMHISRRLRIRQAHVEDVDVLALAEFQAGLCYLCSLPMGLDVTLDHVTPIVSGGRHSYENGAASHLRCNSRKKEGTLLNYYLRWGRLAA